MEPDGSFSNIRWTPSTKTKKTTREYLLTQNSNDPESFSASGMFSNSQSNSPFGSPKLTSGRPSGENSDFVGKFSSGAGPISQRTSIKAERTSPNGLSSSNSFKFSSDGTIGTISKSLTSKLLTMIGTSTVGATSGEIEQNITDNPSDGTSELNSNIPSSTDSLADQTSSN
ncbi:hypothetical protein SNEBB_005641 [Seison nebaliae]|nr:hypothetical protein SNEBB_005641 [Seison nebaliae]